MGRIIQGQVVASTGLDAQGERLTHEVLVGLFNQIVDRGMPTGVNHDLSATPICRSFNPRLENLTNGELAIVVDLEILDEEAFAPMGGFSIAFIRKTIRFGKREPAIAILLNPVQFDFDSAVRAIGGSVPEEYEFDISERVEKGLDIPAAIIHLVFSLGSSASAGVAEGFLNAVGAKLLEVISGLKRKDKTEGAKKLHLHFEVAARGRILSVVLEVEEDINSVNLSGVNIVGLVEVVNLLPGIEKAQRIVGTVTSDGEVNLLKLVLTSGVSIGITATVPSRRDEQRWLTAPLTRRKRRKRGLAG
jgi:hypothetical protein